MHKGSLFPTSSPVHGVCWFTGDRPQPWLHQGSIQKFWGLVPPLEILILFSWGLRSLPSRSGESPGELVKHTNFWISATGNWLGLGWHTWMGLFVDSHPNNYEVIVVLICCPWWLVVLSTFSCTCWQFACLPWKKCPFWSKLLLRTQAADKSSPACPRDGVAKLGLGT